MTISLVEVAGANFRTDEKSDRLNDEFMKRLGMRKRYLPARLAISRSLAVAVPLEPLNDEADPGKAIKGDTLFGTGTALSVWLGLITERSADPEMDLKKLVGLVGAHWRRGLIQLDREWEQAGQDLSKFVARLVEVADLRAGRGGKIDTGAGTAETYSNGHIEVPIGEISEDVSTKEKVVWTMNGPGGSPHSAIMGGVGSGKTRTAVSMLRSIRSQGAVPLLAFDFKGDLGTDAKGGGYKIDELFDASVLEPPRMPVPLDVLSISSANAIDIAEAASRFRESFSRLKGSRLGDRQRNALHEAASLAIANRRPCELRHIRDALLSYYEEHEMREDGAISTIQEICRFPLFVPTFSPENFFRQSWIIKLPPNVAEDSRTIVVNLVLDALDQYLNSLVDADTSSDGARGLRILCVVDEAHQVLGSKLPSLANLIRMSRSKGGAVMLISQSPDDFSSEDDEFLSEMGLVVAFSTNAPPKNAARILGKAANLGALLTGQCLVKRRGDQAARRVKAW
jgi:DNA sulfur modification protein DndE